MSILKIDTTLELINNFRGFTNTVVGEGTIVETLGYSTIGDGGGAQWKRTGNLLTASQSPAQLGDARLSDKGSNEWALVVGSSIKIEQLGAKTADADSSAVFVAANASGYDVDLGSATWNASGITVSSTALWFGSKQGATVQAPVGAADRYVFRSTSVLLNIENITFDAANMTIGCFALVIDGISAGISAENVTFQNAQIISGYGEGLKVAVSFIASRLINCNAYNNGSTGISVEQTPAMYVSGGTSSGNGGNGYAFNNYDQTLSKNINNLIVDNIYGINNSGSGISFGNPYNDNIFTGDNFGFDNNVCTNVVASNLFATGNATYGIVLSMVHGNVSNIFCRQNAFGGLLVNGRYINIDNATITDNPVYGVDIGQGSDINMTNGRVANNATAGGTGLLLEACQNINIEGIIVKGNGSTVQANIKINTYGGTGDGRYFPRKASRITMACNVFIDGDLRGLAIVDNPENVVDNNTYHGDIPLNSTDYRCAAKSVNCEGAVVEERVYSPVGAGIVVFPDVVRRLNMNSTSTITGLRPFSYDKYLNTCTYATVTAGGSGYTVGATSIVISGDGTSATASVFINQGVVVGIRIDNVGSGYTSATAVISGDGAGATATVTIGSKLLAAKEVTLAHNQAQTITRAASPVINSPSASDLSAPTASSTTLMEQYGNFIVKSATYTV